MTKATRNWRISIKILKALCTGELRNEAGQDRFLLKLMGEMKVSCKHEREQCIWPRCVGCVFHAHRDWLCLIHIVIFTAGERIGSEPGREISSAISPERELRWWRIWYMSMNTRAWIPGPRNILGQLGTGVWVYNPSTGRIHELIDQLV